MTFTDVHSGRDGRWHLLNVSSFTMAWPYSFSPCQAWALRKSAFVFFWFSSRAWKQRYKHALFLQLIADCSDTVVQWFVLSPHKRRSLVVFVWSLHALSEYSSWWLIQGGPWRSRDSWDLPRLVPTWGRSCSPRCSSPERPATAASSACRLPCWGSSWARWAPASAARPPPAGLRPPPNTCRVKTRRLLHVTVSTRTSYRFWGFARTLLRPFPRVLIPPSLIFWTDTNETLSRCCTCC